MKRTNKKDRDRTAFIYVRLSRDDGLDGESYSINNQKKLLTKAAKDAGYTNLVIYADDGVSGVTMNRPGFQAMLAELEKDHAAAVYVKDMSRLGRNYIEVGKLTEEFFPQHEIRLVAISDGEPVQRMVRQGHFQETTDQQQGPRKLRRTSWASTLWIPQGSG